MSGHHVVKMDTAFLTITNMVKVIDYVNPHVQRFNLQLKASDVTFQGSMDPTKTYVRFAVGRSALQGTFIFRINKILAVLAKGKFEVIAAPKTPYIRKVITTLHDGELSVGFDPTQSSFKTIAKLDHVLMRLDTHVTKDSNCLYLTDIFVVGESNTVRKVYRWLSYSLKSEGIKTFNESVWDGLIKRIPLGLDNEHQFRVIGILNQRPVDLRTLEYIQPTEDPESNIVGSLTLGLSMQTLETGLRSFTNLSEYTLKSVNLLSGASLDYS